MQVGQAVTVHMASCESVEQHRRVTVAGEVTRVYDDGAALALLEDGSEVELCPWFTSDCPNAVAVGERAA